ncbi:MAG: hypothetical protein K8F25_02795 [Fimbriimonadaceae bacterium]|nr:hypothetical protein [Alphaproteobacteria bacterium]
MIAKILLFLNSVAIPAALGAVITFYGIIFVETTFFGSSQREGALAMGAAGLAPAGALVGAGLGIWLAWLIITRMSDASILGSGYGITALMAFAVGGWFLYQNLKDGNPYAPEDEPTVLIEWRLPELVRHDSVDRIFRFTMRSSYKDWTLSTRWDEPRARDEDDNTILRVRGQIRWRVKGRIFQLWRASNQDDRITIEIDLPRDPKPTAGYSPWHEVEGNPGHAYRTRIVDR